MSSMGVLGVVFHVSSLKSVRVVTEHGILVHGNKRPASFPHDKYQIRRKSQVKWHGGPLERLQKTISEGTFDESSQSRVTLQAACRLIHGGRTGRSKCSCKKRCGPSCGCRKASRRCTSACKCLGNCEYSQQYTKTNAALETACTI